MIHSGTATAPATNHTRSLSLSRWHSPPQPKIDPPIIRGHHTYPLRTCGEVEARAAPATSTLSPQTSYSFVSSSPLPSSLARSLRPPPSTSFPVPESSLAVLYTAAPARARARPRSCGAAPLTRMALICISRIHYAILPCIEQTITGQRPRGM